MALLQGSESLPVPQQPTSGIINAYSEGDQTKKWRCTTRLQNGDSPITLLAIWDVSVEEGFEKPEGAL
jgi:hypothetical protein